MPVDFKSQDAPKHDVFTGQFEGTSAVFNLEGNPEKTFSMDVSLLPAWRQDAFHPAVQAEIDRAIDAAEEQGIHASV